MRMADVDRDTLLRPAAFEHVRKLGETHDHLTATELKPGFVTWRCCMKTLCRWGGVARISRDPPQEPHYGDEVEGPSQVQDEVPRCELAGL